MRQPPTLARIRKRLDLLERRQVVDEARLRLPRELDQGLAPDDDALAEVALVERRTLQDLAGLEAHLADGRLPVEARAFVQHAVEIHEALRERRPVVRVHLDNFVGRNRYGSLARRRRLRQQRGPRRPVRCDQHGGEPCACDKATHQAVNVPRGREGSGGSVYLLGDFFRFQVPRSRFRVPFQVPFRVPGSRFAVGRSPTLKQLKAGCRV